MRRLVLAAALAFFAFAGSAGAATYYVSASGNDANGGGSPSSAWKTVGRVDDATLAPGNTITNTGDSGILIVGSAATVSNNTVSHTGTNAAITYGKHGIYAKGPDVTISGNDFSDNPHGQSISIRAHGARVIGNTIHDT